VTPQDQVEDVADAVELLAARPDVKSIGVAGSSSGAAVALAAAAAAVGGRIAALVLRAPSADASFADARRVRAPALLIQGELDELLERNQLLVQQFPGECRLRVVSGAGHLFEEPGALATASDETVRWFRRWLNGERQDAGGRSSAAPRAAGFAPAASHFADRPAAGRALVPRLQHLAAANPLVLALPRGGIDVAEPIARSLSADLDVFVSRKLRAPSQPELAIGALAEGDVVVWNEELLRDLEVPGRALRAELERVRAELADRVAEYRAVMPRIPIAGRTLVVVDDGVATGATLKAALAALREQRPARLVVALPGGAPDTLDEIARNPGVDELVALARPSPFFAVGELYDEFAPVSSQRVCEVLRRHCVWRQGAAARRAERAARSSFTKSRSTP
jgi:putative phosphoribosyl transferase